MQVLRGRGLLEQDMLSNFLFDHASGLWAVFHPELVSLFIDAIPMQVLRVKVQHACGSRAGSKTLSLYRTRRLYYSLLPLCVSSDHSGPQHPCCVLHGYERSVFKTEALRLPPFVRGAIYGPAWGNSAFGVMGDLHTAGDAVFDFWMVHCEEMRKERMLAW